MNRLQLATLLSWSGDSGLKGRKRLQKVVFLLQRAGCQLDCQFTLHNFGPYSRDVADICDEMVAIGLITEEVIAVSQVKKYSYKLTESTKSRLEQLKDDALQPFRELGEKLISEELWDLELGATISFFLEKTNDIDKACAEACRYKKIPFEEGTYQKALNLVKLISEETIRIARICNAGQVLSRSSI